jgi:hypothetical protein
LLERDDDGAVEWAVRIRNGGDGAHRGQCTSDPTIHDSRSGHPHGVAYLRIGRIDREERTGSEERCHERRLGTDEIVASTSCPLVAGDAVGSRGPSSPFSSTPPQVLTASHPVRTFESSHSTANEKHDGPH